jgi:hypothetical protein
VLQGEENRFEHMRVRYWVEKLFRRTIFVVRRHKEALRKQIKEVADDEVPGSRHQNVSSLSENELNQD